ncbi:hypothetical protein [Sphingobium chlorophenolicum]|uniref:hypothetical protein n=1 Tax=Sphingobium chlorophenolicum TaxID=46429 RepID=UPI0020B81967|nr:hypothetical protein [Sphingobium chlorophenolicum]
MLERFHDARLQIVLSIGAGRIADHALVIGKLVVEQKRIVPGELRHVAHKGLSSEISKLPSCCPAPKIREQRYASTA